MSVKKINVLLVEDNQEFSNQLIRMIKKNPAAAQFSFELATSLKECFTTLESGNTDIVLLDLGLSDSHGLETIETFRQTYPDIPVIILTAHSEKSIGLKSIKKGASDFLEKEDINSKELIRAILHSLERHEIQQQLRIERQNVRDYLDLAGVIIISIDIDQKITMINKVGCRTLGYSDEELLGKNWFDTFSPSRKANTLKRKFSKIIANETETPVNFEGIIVNAKGQNRVISWNRKFIRDANNNITGILGSGTDVTARKNSKRRLKNISNQIVEHDIEKSEFVINISHELRTPLTIFKNIISNALAGTSGKLNKKITKDLKIADKVIGRLSRIITDFLEISKIEAGKMQLNLEPIDAQRLITDAVEIHKPLIDSNYMDVEISTPDEPLSFAADYSKMILIMGKLIENAAKFVPDCGGKMTIRATDLNDNIAIEIEDNGPGIQGDDINRVFNRFIQVQRDVGAGDHGTGMGLAITKELVQIHYGKIWVENIISGGTIFRMVIPKKPPETQRDESYLSSEIEKTISSLSDQADQIADICTEVATEAVTEKSEPPEVIEEPPIDWKLAISYCGDETVVKRIVSSILKESPDQLKSLIEAVEAQNQKDTVYFAHKLKGAILTVGATDLPEKAETIELAAEINDFDMVNDTMPRLQREYDKFVNFFKDPNWVETVQQVQDKIEHEERRKAYRDVLES